ncbi:MAG: type III-A CRISPR-associated protein Cas10/Csm1, partial [Culicoidibacterales bacterium]
MELTNSQLTIAALVHDIGKLYQRAKMPLGEFADAKGVYLPFQKKGNYYSHEHALYTAKWMKDFITNDERFIQVSALHHRHDINEADIVHWVELIKRADRLASGLDRNEYPDDYEGKAKNYKQTRLHSLYNRLHGRKTEHEGIYELIQTGPNDCFPVNYTQKQNQDSEAEYKKLVEQLEKQMRFLPNETLDETFVHRLLNIFEATLTTIPAATNAYPDHSLFDHSKVVAAIAGCLYSAHAETKPFLLVEGDLSGIQKFIFEVTEGEQTRKHVAKSLRGRSTFMTLLTDFIAAYLVSEVGVMATNILYSSGGTFQIILPNTQAAKLK